MPDFLPAELREAKQFHGHLGPYLVIGMAMGDFFASSLGEKPFSYKIEVACGHEPPPSCIIDGLQVTTPCTIGNSMLVAHDLAGTIWARAETKEQKVELMLRPKVRERIDKETTRENEEQIAVELYESGAEELFIIAITP